MSVGEGRKDVVGVVRGLIVVSLGGVEVLRGVGYGVRGGW